MYFNEQIFEKRLSEFENAKSYYGDNEDYDGDFDKLKKQCEDEMQLFKSFYNGMISNGKILNEKSEAKGERRLIYYDFVETNYQLKLIGG